MASIWAQDGLGRAAQQGTSFHIEEHTAELIRAGHDPKARRQARLELGGTEQIREAVHDTRRTRWLEDLYRDAGYALRALRREPGFAAAALLTLAVGIGATTLMFTIVNGVLLTPLPYPEPERLLTLQEQTEQASQYGTWGRSRIRTSSTSNESRTWHPRPGAFDLGRSVALELLSTWRVGRSRRAFLRCWV